MYLKATCFRQIAKAVFEVAILKVGVEEIELQAKRLLDIRLAQQRCLYLRDPELHDVRQTLR
jgi:hypothetical protein